MKDYNEYIEQECSWLSRHIAEQIINHGKDKDTRIKIWRVLEGIGLEQEVGGTSTYIYNQPNFRKLAEILDLLDTAGISLESVKVRDEPETRSKSARIALPSDNAYYINCYLAQEAECELIEVSRTPQPDKIQYELRCNNEPEGVEAES